MLLKMTLQTSAGVVDVETLDGQPFGEHSGIKVTTPENIFTLTAEMRPLDSNVTRIADALATQNGFMKQQFVDDVIKKSIADFNALSDIDRTIKRRNETKAAITELYVIMKAGGEVVAHTRDHADALFGDEGNLTITEIVKKNSTVMPSKAAENQRFLNLLDDIRAVVIPTINLNRQTLSASAQPAPTLSVDDFGDVLDDDSTKARQGANEITVVVDEPTVKSAAEPIKPAPVVARVVEGDPRTRVVEVPVTAEVVEINPAALAEVKNAPKAEVEVRSITPSYVVPVATQVSPARAPRREADALDAGIDILDMHTGFTRPNVVIADAPARSRGRPTGATRIGKAQRADAAIPDLDDAQADLFAVVAPAAPEGDIVELDFVDLDFGDDLENPEFDPEDFRM